MRLRHDADKCMCPITWPGGVDVLDRVTGGRYSSTDNSPLQTMATYGSAELSTGLQLWVIGDMRCALVTEASAAACWRDLASRAYAVDAMGLPVPSRITVARRGPA